MNLDEFLISLSLSFSISCVWFLSRSFLLISLPFLRVLGCGAIPEDVSRLFGSRWELVETVIRQKAEVIYGLSLFLFASLLNFIMAFELTYPRNLLICIIIIVVATTIFIIAGHCLIIPYLYYKFFINQAKASLSSNEKLKKLDSKQFNENIRGQLKCYHLSQPYEKWALKELEKYATFLNGIESR